MLCNLIAVLLASYFKVLENYVYDINVLCAGVNAVAARQIKNGQVVSVFIKNGCLFDRKTIYMLVTCKFSNQCSDFIKALLASLKASFLEKLMKIIHRWIRLLSAEPHWKKFDLWSKS